MISSDPRRRAVLFGLGGVILITLGMKAMLDLGLAVPQTLHLECRPALLLFTFTDGCECVMELAHSADAQLQGWNAPAEREIQLFTIDFDRQKGLVNDYQVFRAPALILLDANGEVVHRQDYPLAEGGPFNLAEFEAEMQDARLFRSSANRE